MELRKVCKQGLGAVLLSTTLAAGFSLTEASAASRYSISKDGIIEIKCNAACDVKKTVLKVVSQIKSDLSPEQQFQIVIQGGISDSFTYLEFKSIYLDDVMHTEDAPLECEWDPDYSCQQWVQIEFVNYVTQEILSSEIEIDVTQDYIDANNDARQLAIAAATNLAVGGIAARVAAELSVIIYPAISATAVAMLLDYLLIKTEWYQTDLTPGDKLVFEGGVMRVVKDGSGDSGNNVGQNNYGTYNYGNWWIGLGTFNYDCYIHYTGSGGVYFAQTVCY